MLRELDEHGRVAEVGDPVGHRAIVGAELAMPGTPSCRSGISTPPLGYGRAMSPGLARSDAYGYRR